MHNDSAPTTNTRRARARLALSVISIAAVATVGITLSADAGTENLLSEDQQTFETPRVAGWLPRDGASVATSTAQAYEGERSLEIRAGATTAGGFTNPAAVTVGGDEAATVRGGATYEGSVWIRSGSSARRAVRCEVMWFRANGTQFGSARGPLLNQAASTWQRVTCGGTAPVGAARAVLRVVVQRATSGERHYVDEAWLVDTGSTSAATTSNFTYRANVGSTGPFLATGGATFEPDSNFLGGNVWAGAGGTDIQGTTDDALYRKHRWGLAGYDVPVPGSGTYTVRLHFAETVMTRPGQRVFDVAAEGSTVLNDLDVQARVGTNVALMEELTVRVTDGTLNLRFTSVVEDPMLSGLEVLGSTAANAAPPPPTTAPTTPPSAPTTTAPSTPATTTPRPPTTTPPTTTPPTTTPPTTVPPSTPTGPVSEGVCTGRVSGGVPADRYPGAACTGVVAGTALTSRGSLRIEQAGSTWTNLNVSGDVCVAADNVTIRNSRITGVITVANSYGHGGCGVTGGAQNLTLIDVEVRPNNATAVAIEGGIYRPGITCTRCNLHRAGAGINGGSYSLIDTYIHDLLGESSCARYPGDCISHNDGLQIGGAGGNVTITHSNIEGSYAPESTGGGMSCALCLYSHNDWGPMANVLVERSRIQSDDAVFCAYGGDSNEQNPTNIRYIGNTFIRSATGTCGSGGPITGWHRGGGNIWSNNRFDDGTAIGEPG